MYFDVDDQVENGSSSADEDLLPTEDPGHDFTTDADADAAALHATSDARASPESDALETRLEPKLQRHRGRRSLADGFKHNKVVNEVLDRPTIMTLYKMITDGVLSGVNGSISAGKESLVFWGLDGDGADVALKIYLVSTSNFKRRQEYMQGDPRFSSMRKNTRGVVYTWAKKEFKNLAQCAAAGIPVPKPIRVSNNVLAMEFVGRGQDGAPGRPAARLVDHRNVTYDDYGQAITMLRDMYSKARLVHGDYSEYNIFKDAGGRLVVFDMGSAVDLRHPGSGRLLQRDINNITRFFTKRGVDVESDTAKVMGDIIR